MSTTVSQYGNVVWDKIKLKVVAVMDNYRLYDRNIDF